MPRILILILLICAPASAWSADFGDQIVKRLTEQGYKDIRIGRTLLRKLRIRAENDEGTREIVVHPRSGTIVHDTFLWHEDDGPDHRDTDPDPDRDPSDGWDILDNQPDEDPAHDGATDLPGEFDHVGDGGILDHHDPHDGADHHDHDTQDHEDHHEDTQDAGSDW